MNKRREKQLDLKINEGRRRSEGVERYRKKREKKQDGQSSRKAKLSRSGGRYASEFENRKVSSRSNK